MKAVLLLGALPLVAAAAGGSAVVAKVGVNPVNLDVVAGDVWVPDDIADTLTRIDGETGRVVETIPTGKNPAVVAGAAGDVWTTMYDDGPGLADPPE